MYKKISFLFLCTFTLLVSGCRQSVKQGDRVTLFYKITDIQDFRLDESASFNNFNRDSSDNLFAFTVGNNEVIKGWDSVIIGCKKDQLYNFVIPSNQAYKEDAIYNDIKPNSPLKLSFEIIDIQ